MMTARAVSPIWVSYAAAQLRGTGVKTCTVIGFPQGATPTAVKVFETQQAIAASSPQPAGPTRLRWTGSSRSARGRR